MPPASDPLEEAGDEQGAARVEDEEGAVARAERRLSQAELADLVGVTRQTVSAVETGQYCPSALLAFLLARELGKRVDEMFFIEGEVK
jgi:putative transcriptional regulator